MNESIFKAYDIRGLYPEQIDEDAVWKIGFAAARFLRSHLRGYDRGDISAQSIIVGRDMRSHSPALAQALIDGMTAADTPVIDIGMVDTPQIYFAINHLSACGGIQVTASHNPAQYNGCKISGQLARPIGEQTGLADIKHIALAMSDRKTTSTKNTKPITKDLTEAYKRHVLAFLTHNPKKLKIVIDASNGMAGKWVPILFDSVNLDIIPLNYEHDGTFIHDPNPLVEKNLVQLKQKVKETAADLGICFDGDADRLILVDEAARTVSCDLLTALMAVYFLRKNPSSTVVYDLRSSWVVKEEIIAAGGKPKRDRVGHAFIKKTMKNNQAVFGGELSGHFYYKDNFYTDSGVITFVHLINILSEQDKPLSALIKPLRRYHASGELNFEVEDKEAMIDQLAQKFSDAHLDHLDGITIEYDHWWFNCRPSNTEPLLRLNLEAKTKKLLKEKLAELKSLLGKPVPH